MTPDQEPTERGRYAIFEQPDGGLVIPRSAPLCERCADCGCGEQQGQLEIPAGAVPVLQAFAEGGLPAVIKIMGNGPMKIPGKLKGMMRL